MLLLIVQKSSLHVLLLTPVLSWVYSIVVSRCCLAPALSVQNERNNQAIGKLVSKMGRPLSEMLTHKDRELRQR
jgi:hypothetical protein